MEKGFYSAIIGLLAIMLLTSTIILVRGNQQFERNYGYAKAFPDIKAEQQNAFYILDITSTDALSDSINDSTCSLLGNDEINGKLLDYFESSLEEMQSNCSIENGQIRLASSSQAMLQPNNRGGAGTRTYNVNDFIIDFTLQCKLEKKKNSQTGQTITEASVSYSVYEIIKKQLVLFNDSGTCKFTIIDSISGFIEKVSHKSDPLIPGAIVMEAESANTITAFNDPPYPCTNASNSACLYTVNAGQGSAAFQGIVKPAGISSNDFKLCGRVVAQNAGENSFIADYAEATTACVNDNVCKTWDLLHPTIDTGFSLNGVTSPDADWKWDSMNRQGPSHKPYSINPIGITLGASPATLTIKGLEQNAGLDKIMIIPQEYACPNDQY